MKLSPLAPGTVKLKPGPKKLMKYDRELKKIVEYATTRAELPATTTPNPKPPKSKSVFREVLGLDSLRFNKGDYMKITMRDRMNTVTHGRSSRPTFHSVRLSQPAGDDGVDDDEWLKYLELDSSTQTDPLEEEIGPYNDLAPFPVQGIGPHSDAVRFPSQEEDLEPEYPEVAKQRKKARSWNTQTRNIDAYECRFRSKVHSVKKQQLNEFHQKVLAQYCRERCDLHETKMHKCKQRLEIKPGNLLGKKCEKCCHPAIRSFRKAINGKPIGGKITNRRVCVEI